MRLALLNKVMKSKIMYNLKTSNFRFHQKFLSVLVLFSLLYGFSVNAAELINRAVAQVGTQVITARQVWVSNIYDRWKVAGSGALSPQPDWKPPIKSDSFRQALNSLILEIMVIQEAESFSIAKVEADEVDKKQNTFSKAVQSFSGWTTLEVSDSELKKMVERKMRSQNFLNFKTESANLIVTDQEAQSYFEKNRLKFGNLPFSQFQESIKDVLRKQVVENRLKDWLDILRRKYRVRLIGAIDDAN